MKKLFLTITLFMCLPVLADWKYIGTEDASESEFFLDFETLRKDGNLRRIWQVVNLKSDDPNGRRSIRSRLEFDCKNETVQSLARMAFSDKLAGGNVIHKSDDLGPKTYIPPKSILSLQLQEVCKR